MKKLVIKCPAGLSALWNRLDWWLCTILPGPIRWWWSRLWIRKNEFHPSLNLQAEYYCKLKPKKLATYWKDFIGRRQIAHEADLKGELKKA